MLRRVAASLLVCLVFLDDLAFAKRSRPKRKRIATPEIVYKVAPSDAIDDRVKVEIGKAEGILRLIDPRTVLESPYLVSAVYYHDGFLAEFPAEKADADPARRIVGQITRMLTPARKRELIEVMRDVASEHAPQPDRRAGLVVPVEEPELGGRRRRRPPHLTAVDLFAPEGSPVRSASPGLVVLSESNWNLADPFSTTSQKGGNTVVVFDATTYRFYRYAHLGDTTVPPGAFVRAGQPIGHVGHSGLNASRPKHGRHLHFEVNEFDGRTVRTLRYADIRRLLALGR